MPIALSVNLNKIALIRNSREGNFPCVEDFGRLCLDNGASGLTIHPRPDQRHIRATDVAAIAAIVNEYRAPNRHVEFNIEGNPFAPAQGSYPGFIELVAATQPDQCTLVPDSDEQKTSDHGFNLKADGERLRPIIETLKSFGCRVSLFMDPDLEQIDLAASVGADRIELYTGPFAEAYAEDIQRGESIFLQHSQAAQHAYKLGLGVNAGHDLNLRNMILYKQLPHLSEVSIGHALTVEALISGWVNTINAYKAICL